MRNGVSIASLNPCFNGRYSQSVAVFNDREDFLGLNPCFNGRYSQSVRDKKQDGPKEVLILVLMEDTLREVSLREIVVRL